MKKLIAWIGMFNLFCALSLSASQMQKIDVGLSLGTKAPELSVTNQFANPMQLNQLMRQKGLVLVVFRSADWCPYCKKHLLELNPLVDEFYKLGFGVAAVSYDSPKILREFAQTHSLKFELLSDRMHQTFERYRLLRTDIKPGHRHYGIPWPGVLVIDSEGVIRFKYFFEGYKQRVRFKQLLKQLQDAG